MNFKTGTETQMSSTSGTSHGQAMSAGRRDGKHIRHGRGRRHTASAFAARPEAMSSL
jgi:hypothetical protein